MGGRKEEVDEGERSVSKKERGRKPALRNRPGRERRADRTGCWLLGVDNREHEQGYCPRRIRATANSQTCQNVPKQGKRDSIDWDTQAAVGSRRDHEFQRTRSSPDSCRGHPSGRLLNSRGHSAHLLHSPKHPPHSPDSAALHEASSTTDSSLSTSGASSSLAVAPATSEAE